MQRDNSRANDSGRRQERDIEQAMNILDAARLDDACEPVID
jgi:hypothetical protein